MDNLAKQSSDVKREFGQFVDAVIHKSPQFVRRRRDRFMSINVDHAMMIFQTDESAFDVTLERDSDGTYLATMKSVSDLIGYGKTEEDALNQLAMDLEVYAEDYLQESFPLYSRDPNRRKHFPILLKIMMQDNLAEVKRLFHVQYARP